jgi:hypothetical protein
LGNFVTNLLQTVGELLITKYERLLALKENKKLLIIVMPLIMLQILREQVGMWIGLN